MLHSDLILAARALLLDSPGARDTAADKLIAEADAADRYRRRFGRAHPHWGNGTLMARAGKWSLLPEPPLRDPDFSACLVSVLGALMRRGGAISHSMAAAPRSKPFRSATSALSTRPQPARIIPPSDNTDQTFAFSCPEPI
ncbi:hypothetical protein P775_18680 [Puniceibacterium antarcticum]|uniref:DUF7742 domain-containing protein n=1 Tax=Puniceibacterium antarcticum TaxID=1206336 RepID=A0A2G8RBV7_9RHOB|nr:hypothetical protein P775_18680 [Puniceibacterium antarcticum]